MKDNKFLNWLIEEKSVYYIYNRGSIIYDIQTSESDTDFLVVVDPEFIIPEEFEEFKYEGYRHRKIPYNILCDNFDFVFFSTEEWFQKVLNGDIEAWECACLNKKFIHKEHVKLLMSTNPVKLRKDFDSWLELQMLVALQYQRDNKLLKYKKALWEIIKRCKFTNQIIENHKIVNFKAAMPEYMLLVNNNNADEDETLKMWLELFKEERKHLQKLTDGMLLKDKQKKIIQDA